MANEANVFETRITSDRNRLLIDLIGFLAGCAFILLAYGLNKTGAIGDGVARVWFGLSPEIKFPVTIQTVSWVCFFVGLSEVAQSYAIGRRERRHIYSDPIKGKRFSFLKDEDIKTAYLTMVNLKRQTYVSRIVVRVLTSYQVNKNTTECSSVLSSSIDLMAHEINIRYNLLRYLMWLIPTLGFVGTVLGIGAGLGVISRNPMTIETAPTVMGAVTSALAVAFDTTFVALILTAILAFLVHLVENTEERALNEAAEYCLDRVINRLKP